MSQLSFVDICFFLIAASRVFSLSWLDHSRIAETSSLCLKEGKRQRLPLSPLFLPFRRTKGERLVSECVDHPVRIVATFVILLLSIRNYSNILCLLSHLIVIILLQHRYDRYPMLTHENTETQRRELTSQLTLYNHEPEEMRFRPDSQGNGLHKNLQLGSTQKTDTIPIILRET